MYIYIHIYGLQEDYLKRICKNMGHHAVRMEPPLSFEMISIIEAQEEMSD
jgi:hypothetical protein